MKICFPVNDMKGLESNVYEHFGSAPGFVVVDTEARSVEEIHNGDLHHAHGMCQPMAALGGLKVDGVVVGGIGMGALMKLQGLGIHVFRANPGTVAQNLEYLRSGFLQPFGAQQVCQGHGDGCAHS
ncbi:MAG: NifB/NifX family molybdenum-iron cluster-binding protein [Syntrophobacteraceae bacterium]